MSHKINFSNVNKPLPEGKYNVIGSEFYERKTKNGKPYIEVVYEVFEGEFAGRKIYDQFHLSENALPKLKKALWAKGVNLDTGEIEVKEGLFLGKTCEVDVFVDEFDGEKKNRVHFKGYAPWVPKGGVPVDTSPNVIVTKSAQFDEIFKDLI